MTTRVAVVQAASVRRESGLFDTEASVGVAVQRVVEAAGNGAKVVVFPEAFLGGYPKGSDFGARVGVRTEEGRRAFRHYLDSAVQIPGPELARVAEVAAAHGISVVMGCVERAGGTLYCTVVLIGPDGELLGKRRKVMPTGMERLIWGFGDGSTLAVVDTPSGRLGAVICWENYMPLLRMAMYQQGIQLYCACTVDDRDSWVPTMRHIAIEGRCFVLSACQYVEGLIRGGSLIVNPFGELLAGPVYGHESILYADIDLGQITEGKFDLDVVGHYARPDLFKLRVNRQVQSVVRDDEPASEQG